MTPASDDKNTKLVHNKNKHLKGKEEGLGSNVFSYGHVTKAEIYNRTVLEIAEYVGKKYCKEMLTLIKDGKEDECPPKMPKRPTAGKEGVNEIDMVTIKSDYDRYRDKTEEYDEYKAKGFLTSDTGSMYTEYETED